MKVRHDVSIYIATAPSRKAKQWHNEKVQWSAFIDRFTATHRTGETLAEYKAMSKEEQSQRKDVGGFVGGYLEGGSRQHVKFRDLICLDADFALPDGSLIDTFQLIGFSGLVYSTHKHTPAAPRLRFVLPFSRSVTPEEYEACARWLASVLGIEQFDDSTYQPARLMYWPSSSDDGEYVFRFWDGEVFNPDDALQTYVNWKDITAWPRSSREADIRKKAVDKAEDPLTKPGLIGAFCNAYSIQDAIATFIPDVYTPCEEPGRYTYTGGSTGAGAVVYDDKFLYSHHATDPCSEQLVNAWDLIRIHKFRELDEHTRETTKIDARPSYKAMVALAAADPEVLKVQAKALADDFDSDTDWLTGVKFDHKGVPVSSIQNIRYILENDPKLKGKLAYDEFYSRERVLDTLPWPSVGACPRTWTDSDHAGLREYLETRYKIVGKEKIKDAATVTMLAHCFHPVRDYLDSLIWDGTERLDTLLIDYLGSEDTPYTRAICRKTFTAAVARIYQPGIKFDYCLTIQGEQGIGKSQLVQRMAKDWFSDSLADMNGKSAFEQLRGKWILEISELASLRRSEIETVKKFVTSSSDSYRAAYAQCVSDYPRQCVFIGTTNDTNFLRDASGNRRFWVVGTPNKPAKDIWTDLNVDQVWAEAKYRYEQHEKLYLPRSLEKVAAEMQEEFRMTDPREGIISDYLERLLPEDWDKKNLFERRGWLKGNEAGTVRRERVCISEIYAEALGMDDKPDKFKCHEIADMMRLNKGWRSPEGDRFMRTTLYGRQRYYRRIEE